MLLKLIAALPVLVSVTTCAAVLLPTLVAAKVKLVGDSVIAGTPTPEPLRVTAWVEGEALSERVIDAGSEPADLGVNAMESEQELPTVRDAPQVLLIV
jgi:hypothetical protein